MPRKTKITNKNKIANKNKNKVNVVVNVNSHNKKKTHAQQPSQKPAASVPFSIGFSPVHNSFGFTQPQHMPPTFASPAVQQVQQPQNIPSAPLPVAPITGPIQNTETKKEWVDPNKPSRGSLLKRVADATIGRIRSLSPVKGRYQPKTEAVERLKSASVQPETKKEEVKSEIKTPPSRFGNFVSEIEEAGPTLTSGIRNPSITTNPLFEESRRPSGESSARPSTVSSTFYARLGLPHPDTPTLQQQAEGVRRMFGLRPRIPATDLQASEFGPRGFR